MKALEEYPTPETEAAILDKNGHADSVGLYNVVDAETTRKLEQRLAACRGALEAVAQMDRDAIAAMKLLGVDVGDTNEAVILVSETLELTKS